MCPAEPVGKLSVVGGVAKALSIKSLRNLLILRALGCWQIKLPAYGGGFKC